MARPWKSISNNKKEKNKDVVSHFTVSVLFISKLLESAHVFHTNINDVSELQSQIHPTF